MTQSNRLPPIQFRDKDVEAALAQRTEEGQTLGTTARRTLTRYFEALGREQGLLGLTSEEWGALKMATLSRAFELEERGPYRLHHSVLDAVESGDLTAGTDISSLAQKLKALTPLQEVAVIDLLEGWRMQP